MVVHVLCFKMHIMIKCTWACMYATVTAKGHGQCASSDIQVGHIACAVSARILQDNMAFNRIR